MVLALSQLIYGILGDLKGWFIQLTYSQSNKKYTC